MEQIILGLAALAATGIAAGFMAGLLGVGGGIILVPALAAYNHYFYPTIDDGVLMHTAIGTSMAIIIPTGMSSAWAQIKRQMVDWAAIKRLIPGLLVGVSIGVIIAARLNGGVLQVIFGLGMVVIAALVAKRPSPNHIHSQLLNWPVVVPVTTTVGVLATLLGIGGSILNIPYMTYAGIPLHRAIATGSVLGILVALPAAIGFIASGIADAILPPEFLGYINIKAWLCIVPFSIVMAPIGVKASHRLNADRLRRYFAGFILIVAAKMLWNVFAA